MRAGLAALTAIDNNHPGSADRDLLLEQGLVARAKAVDSEAFEILMVRPYHPERLPGSWAKPQIGSKHFSQPCGLGGVAAP
jgi:hypothetical protein